MASLSVLLVIAGVLVVLAIIVVAVLLILLSRRAREVNLKQAEPGEKPDWVRTTPPPERGIAPSETDDGLYGQEAGEAVAAPFAEQIEDIIRDKLRMDPLVAHYNLDLGTGEDGGLVIWVDGTRYDGVEALPDPRLRALFQEAVARWEETQA
jgi:hypothetical protein